MQAGQHASFRGRRCFSKVDWDQCSERTKSRTLENTNNNEHSNVHAPAARVPPMILVSAMTNKVHFRPIVSARGPSPSAPTQTPKIWQGGSTPDNPCGGSVISGQVMDSEDLDYARLESVVRLFRDHDDNHGCCYPSSALSYKLDPLWIIARA
jgi:hypothetical protein